MNINCSCVVGQKKLSAARLVNRLVLIMLRGRFNNNYHIVNGIFRRTLIIAQIAVSNFTHLGNGELLPVSI